MLTAACALLAVGVYAALRYRAALCRARAELGIARVRVADLPGRVGDRVRFRHPTRRREYVEGRLLAARESLLCLAWLRITVESPGGSRTDYEVAARDWADVARQ